MKIAHIQWAMTSGGIENMLADIVNEQSKIHDVVLYVINDVYDQFVLDKISSRVRVVLIGRKPGTRNPIPLFKLNYFLWRQQPDVVHTHQYKGINCVWYRGGVRVRTIHNTNNKSEEYHRFDKLISISKAVKIFTNEQGFDSVEIDNGIVVSRIKNRHENTFNDGKKHFIQVGRLQISQKGQDVLIKALKILKYDFCRDDFHMHFVGEGTDQKVLQKLVDDCNLHDDVSFDGVFNQSFLYEHLCDYNLFIQPSRYEGFGLTVAEACAAKIPVIVSNIEGPLEIIDGGLCGWNFESENPCDLARKINSFLLGEYPLEFIENAYVRTCKLYNVSRTAAQYIDLYNQLMQKKGQI